MQAFPAAQYTQYCRLKTRVSVAHVTCSPVGIPSPMEVEQLTGRAITSSSTKMLRFMPSGSQTGYREARVAACAVHVAIAAAICTAHIAIAAAVCAVHAAIAAVASAGPVARPKNTVKGILLLKSYTVAGI